mmetsp:Transcript_4674/g.18659  ORF Transcript_4674/g.18659 Transcript_4674/m.18659 type:complete len:274 (-) Transcript_4674:197-1018(-)
MEVEVPVGVVLDAPLLGLQRMDDGAGDEHRPHGSDYQADGLVGELPVLRLRAGDARGRVSREASEETSRFPEAFLRRLLSRAVQTPVLVDQRQAMDPEQPRRLEHPQEPQVAVARLAAQDDDGQQGADVHHRAAASQVVQRVLRREEVDEDVEGEDDEGDDLDGHEVRLFLRSLHVHVRLQDVHHAAQDGQEDLEQLVPHVAVQVSGQGLEERLAAAVAGALGLLDHFQKRRGGHMGVLPAVLRVLGVTCSLNGVLSVVNALHQVRVRLALPQ